MGENGDIEIYVKKMLTFLKEKENNYFFDESQEEIFKDRLRIFALKNIKEKGSPELTMEQMEEIRTELKFKPIKNGSTITYSIIGTIFLN